MEKFGIFNILSALSQFEGTPAGDDADGPEPNAAPAEKPRGASAPDGAARGQGEAESAGVFTARERMERMAKVLERHDAIARRIDRKNRP